MNEIKFLKNLFPKLRTGKNVIVGPGDDCAAIHWKENKLLLIAVDQLISGQHYTLGKTRAEEAGRKLLTRNLSDIAAMGGTPLYALVTMAIGSGFKEEFSERFYDGILEAAEPYSLQIIGGDICGSSDNHSTTLTIIGEIKQEDIILRSGTQDGDLLFGTGKFGNSFNSEHHLSFQPRLKEGQWLSANKIAKAMIDVSDGLLLDSVRLAKASGLSLSIDTDMVPLRTKGYPIMDALTDGEDYELIFSLNSNDEHRLIDDWPFKTKLTKLGSFSKAESDDIKITNYHGKDLLEDMLNSYNHFDEV